MKPNFPAEVKVVMNGKTHYFCANHGLQIQDENINAELLPDDSQVSCEECVAGRLND